MGTLIGVDFVRILATDYFLRYNIIDRPLLIANVWLADFYIYAEQKLSLIVWVELKAVLKSCVLNWGRMLLI